MAAESMWPRMFHATEVLERAMMAVSTTVSEPIKVAISSFDLIGSIHDAMQPITFQEGATKPIELDVVVGPRLPYGSHVRVKVWGAVILTDHGMSDDNLQRPTANRGRSSLAASL